MVPHFMPIPKVIISNRASQRIRGGHPWVFRSDILKAPSVEPGECVSIHENNLRFLGIGFFNQKSLITLRVLTQKDIKIDKNFWRQRIEDSFQRRKQSLKSHSSLRLVYGECDGLPSLIVDQYKDVVVFQTLSAGMERWKDTIVSLLQEILEPQALVERNDVPVRSLEGLSQQKGIISGNLPAPFVVEEGTIAFLVDPLEGQKTGLFLDQIENHLRTPSFIKGRVLDLFSYQGGFALHSATQAEEVIAVDSSEVALNILNQNKALNGLDNIQPLSSNAFDYLRSCQDHGETFDSIILDPPPFVRGRTHLSGGIRGYKEINLRAMKILKNGGILITCSCSQNFTPDLFEQTLLEAAGDARRKIHILEKRGASPDHPTLLTFPESSYLQCWILRVFE